MSPRTSDRVSRLKATADENPLRSAPTTCPPEIADLLTNFGAIVRGDYRPPPRPALWEIGPDGWPKPAHTRAAAGVPTTTELD